LGGIKKKTALIDLLLWNYCMLGPTPKTEALEMTGTGVYNQYYTENGEDYTQLKQDTIST